MQSKTILANQYVPIIMAKTKKKTLTILNVVEEMKELDSYTLLIEMLRGTAT